MDASELASWTRFVAKGGIGKCTAVLDSDLMFLQVRDAKYLFVFGYTDGSV